MAIHGFIISVPIFLVKYKQLDITEIIPKTIYNTKKILKNTNPIGHFYKGRIKFNNSLNKKGEYIWDTNSYGINGIILA